MFCNLLSVTMSRCDGTFFLMLQQSSYNANSHLFNDPWWNAFKKWFKSACFDQYAAAQDRHLPFFLFLFFFLVNYCPAAIFIINYHHHRHHFLFCFLFVCFLLFYVLLLIFCYSICNIIRPHQPQLFLKLQPPLILLLIQILYTYTYTTLCMLEVYSPSGMCGLHWFLNKSKSKSPKSFANSISQHYIQ